MVTTVDLTFKARSDGSEQVFTWSDPNGDGNVESDEIALDLDEEYDVALDLWNDLEDPREHVTPEVAEAAVIGIAHPKWDERPLLIIVRSEGSEVSVEDILAFMEGKIAKWWMPDDVAFVDEIPHTATGKIQKLALREQFAGHVLPTAKAS